MTGKAGRGKMYTIPSLYGDKFEVCSVKSKVWPIDAIQKR